jgi:hypothetical protein
MHRPIQATMIVMRKTILTFDRQCYYGNVNPPVYEQALRQRGFTFNSSAGFWVGPFNIQVSGYLNDDALVGHVRAIDNGYARAAAILFIDEQLRARRGTPRPPLVPPTKEFSADYQPYQHIMPPGQ